jgi:hypothetical protein
MGGRDAAPGSQRAWRSSQARAYGGQSGIRERRKTAASSARWTNLRRRRDAPIDALLQGPRRRPEFKGARRGREALLGALDEERHGKVGEEGIAAAG